MKGPVRDGPIRSTGFGWGCAEAEIQVNEECPHAFCMFVLRGHSSHSARGITSSSHFSMEVNMPTVSPTWVHQAIVQLAAPSLHMHTEEESLQCAALKKGTLTGNT